MAGDIMCSSDDILAVSNPSNNESLIFYNIK